MLQDLLDLEESEDSLDVMVLLDQEDLLDNKALGVNEDSLEVEDPEGSKDLLEKMLNLEISVLMICITMLLTLLKTSMKDFSKMQIKIYQKVK